MEVNKELEKFNDKTEKLFEGLKLEEKQLKGLLSICYIKDNETGTIEMNVILNNNNLDLAEIIIMLLRSDAKTEFHSIAEAVREYV